MFNMLLFSLSLFAIHVLISINCYIFVLLDQFKHYFFEVMIKRFYIKNPISSILTHPFLNSKSFLSFIFHLLFHVANLKFEFFLSYYEWYFLNFFFHHRIIWISQFLNQVFSLQKLLKITLIFIFLSSLFFLLSPMSLFSF